MVYRIHTGEEEPDSPVKLYKDMSVMEKCELAEQVNSWLKEKLDPYKMGVVLLLIDIDNSLQQDQGYTVDSVLELSNLDAKDVRTILKNMLSGKSND